MNKQEELQEIVEIVSTRTGYDLDYIVARLRTVDPADSFIRTAIEHIKGANGKGVYRKHEVLQNLSWARREIKNYIDERINVERS